MSTVNEHERRAVARIASLRRYCDLTQQQLADAIGMTRVALQAVEGGNRHLRIGEAVALCAALGVDLSVVVSEQPLMLRQEAVKQSE